MYRYVSSCTSLVECRTHIFGRGVLMWSGKCCGSNLAAVGELPSASQGPEIQPQRIFRVPRALVASVRVPITTR